MRININLKLQVFGALAVTSWMSVALSFAGENRWTSNGPEGGIVTRIVGAGPAIYAATFGGGVFRSTDGGESWSAINHGVSNYFVRSIAIDPAEPSTIYAATHGGVIKSVDGGDSWTRPGTLDQAMFEVAIDPSNHLRIYAVSPNALYVSTDGAKQWTDITGDIVVIQGGGLTSFTVDPSQPQYLLCGTTAGLFSSDDRGKSWKLVFPLGGTAITAVAIDPSNSNAIYVSSSNGVIRSKDRGKTWSVLHGPTEVHQFVFAQQVIYAATNFGLWRSPDSGDTWPFVARPEESQVQTIALDPLHAGRVLAGTWGQGIFRSIDNGTTFVQQNRGLRASYSASVASDPANPALIYVASGSGIFKSVDRGESWQIKNSDTAAFSVTLDARRPSTVYVGNNKRPIRTTDSGETWEGVHANPMNASGAMNFTIDPSNSATIYASLADGGLSKSTDSGQTWNYINDGLYVGFYYGGFYGDLVTVDPENPSTLFAASGGIVKSTNGGEKWTSVNTGLNDGDFAARAIAIDPSNSSIVYAGGRAGLFRTMDGGEHWNRIQIGMSDRSVEDVVIDPIDPSIVYVATEHDGIFRSTDRGETWRTMNEGLSGLTALSLDIDSTGRSLTLGSIAGVFTMDMATKLPPEFHAARLRDDGARLPALLAQLRSAADDSSSSAFIVPAAGTIGRPGAIRFRSDLLITNHAARAQDVLIAWLAMGVDGTNAPSFRLTLPGADSTAIPGFVDKLGFYGLGSVLVIALDGDGNFDSAASIDGSSQIWAAGPNNSSTITESLAAVPIKGLRNHATATASDLRHDSNFRTNVGVVNLESEMRTFSIDLIGERRSQTIFVTVQPFSMTHVSVPPGDYGILHAVFHSSDADALWTAYGSSVDNSSGEGTVVTAR